MRKSKIKDRNPEETLLTFTIVFRCIALAPTPVRSLLSDFYSVAVSGASARYTYRAFIDHGMSYNIVYCMSCPQSYIDPAI